MTFGVLIVHTSLHPEQGNVSKRVQVHVVGQWLVKWYHGSAVH